MGERGVSSIIVVIAIVVVIVALLLVAGFVLLRKVPPPSRILKENEILTENDNGKTFGVQSGQSVIISLSISYGEGDGGYTWNYPQDNSVAHIELLREVLGGTADFNVTIIHSGTLVFKLARSWEHNVPPVRTFSASFIII